MQEQLKAISSIGEICYLYVNNNCDISGFSKV